MRLLLTAVAANGAENPGATINLAVDLAVEADPDATVAQLAARLENRLGIRHASLEAGGARGPLGLVTSLGDIVTTDRLTYPPADLWLGGRRLDAGQRLVDSPVRQGAVIGVGGPLPDVLAEPHGLVEIRVASGPGAGTVHRTTVGSVAVGSSPQCPIRLADDALPPVALWIDVAPCGEVVVRPEPGVEALDRPAPTRLRPLDGPIVIPRLDGGGAPRKPRVGWWPARLRRWRADPDAGLPHDDLDPQADVPLVHLARRRLDGDRTWLPGAALVVGATMLELAPVQPPDASLSPSPGALSSDYNRPPRLLPAPRQTTFSLPPEPPRPEKMPIPLLLVVAPVLMSVALYWFTRSPYSLIFAAFSPMMAISNVTSSRRQGTKRYREQIAEYHRRTRQIRGEAYAALGRERFARRTDLPDPATMLLIGTGPRARLWERRDSDPDWLRLRFGTADLASEVTLRDPRREEHEGPLTWTSPDVPVTVDVAAVGVVGIAGPAGLRRSLACWAVAQAATLHSPADLDLVVLAGPDGDDAWSWVRWLPHARPADVVALEGPLARVGTGDEGTAARISELVAVMQARHRMRTDRSRIVARTGPEKPVLVVLDGARRLRLLPGVVSLLQEGPAVGMRFLCLDEDVRLLPEECAGVVSPAAPNGFGNGFENAGGSTGSARIEVRVTGAQPVEGVRPDLVGIAWCERLARALAPVRDVSAEDLAGSLPPSSRLLDVLSTYLPGSALTDPAALAAAWAQAGRTTTAVIGESVDGQFAVDIRRDGPHALVAGTTGSGKSELLQTLIASLAIGNRPDELTFVLVDYKGGAAFKDCRDLPHTVGMVTDLDGHLTTRALDSLAAELRRREHQLAGVGAKDIEDYTSARSLAGGPTAPMPRLMLVIDEFAALVAELPDFVSGLVDIARRGRSLGVHLVLATQRPAGVVSAEIKSNTTLRIALRVTDPQDSQDVIESPEAATISKNVPGRAYARLGHSTLTAFQASRVGGRPRAAGRAGVELRDVGWATLGSTTGSSLSGRAVEEPGDDVSGPSDLATLVSALRTATDLARIVVPPSPWLPPLLEIVPLDSLRLADPGLAAGLVPPVAFGLTDLPARQRQLPATLDLARGNLAVLGAPRSGRSTVLRSIAGAVAAASSPADVHLYGVDCGSNALMPLIALPHTGAVVTRDQPDRLSRLTNRLAAEVSRRQQLLAEQGFAGLAEQRAATPAGQRLPHLLVLLDRWEAFVSTFETYDSGRLVDQWLALLQEGPGVGLSVVLSNDRSGLSGRIGALVDDKLVLRMTDPGDFATIGLPLSQVPRDFPPGRGFRSDGVREVQVALLSSDPSGPAQVAALQAIGRAAADRLDAAGGLPRERRPFRVDPLPARITIADALDLAEAPLRDSELPVAVGGDTLGLRTLDLLEHGPGLIVAGPRRSGRSTALRVLASAALERGWRVGLVTPRLSVLRELGAHHGIACWTPDDDRDTVTGGLKDLLPSAGSAPSLLVVDDLEVLGPDGWLADALTEQLGHLRDSGCGFAGAGTLDELGGVYRGPVVALKRSRSGLLLSPTAPNDGDLFGLRLPRAATGGGPPGRGVLVRAGQWETVQVPLPAAARA